MRCLIRSATDDWPAPGARVAIRYRRPQGSVPPLTDVIGELLCAPPALQVRTRRGDVVAVDVSDVVSVRTLGPVPVRTSGIRNLEHAAALAWPGVQHRWLDGWLLRFAHGHTYRANSAVPLGVSSRAELPQIIDWYITRGLTPWLAAPDRLLWLPVGAPVVHENAVMTRDLSSVTPESPPTPNVTLASRPDDEWLRLYQRDVPVDVLAAVVDGVVVFATVPTAAVGRVAVTTAPDGTRWAGLSALHVVNDQRGRGHARSVCAALLGWAFEQGATRAYVRVLVDNVAATTLYESIGFTVHHRSRYVDARRV